MKKLAYLKFLTVILLVSLCSCNSKIKTFSESDIKIIPKPAELKLNEGVFEFTKNTKFVVDIKNELIITNVLIDKFKNTEGWNLEISNEISSKNYVEFIQDNSLKNGAYNLIVTTEKVTISAKDDSGFMYGLETIRQLLPV